MTPQWGSTYSYAVSYCSRRVCIIKIAPDSFQLGLNTQYNDDFNHCYDAENDAVKDYLIENVITCYSCGSCKPGLCISILGTPIQNSCFNPVLRMIDPDEDLLVLAQKLVLLRRQAILDGKAPKVTYIAMARR